MSDIKRHRIVFKDRMVKMIEWNPWCGCRRVSDGCLNCISPEIKSTSAAGGKIFQTNDFHLPIKRTPERLYRLTYSDNPIYVCTKSDFFIEDADPWRKAVWDIMHFRKDLHFKIITKRIHRFQDCIPKNWGRSYPNVTIVCSCENQKSADERLPHLVDILAAHKEIMLEPLLEKTNVEAYLSSGCIEAVTCSGDSGKKARLCEYSWVMNMREQCVRHDVAFHFKRTGDRFRKDIKIYHIDPSSQIKQAQKADIDYDPQKKEDNKQLIDQTLFHLAKTKYRRQYVLSPKLKEYCRQTGMEKLRRKAFEIVREKVSSPYYKGEGRQTPLDGHPIYIAMHATGTCCRTCLEVWHSIVSGRRLTEKDIIYIVDTIMEWIKRQLEYHIE